MTSSSHVLYTSGVIFAGSSSSAFTNAEGWKLVRERRQKVSWHRSLLFNPTLPKFSLRALIAILHRFLTLDRLSGRLSILLVHCVVLPQNPDDAYFLTVLSLRRFGANF